jgi:pyruvate dehydrogenase E2 component (dihydrolipoamide acetyltransferase)
MTAAFRMPSLGADMEAGTLVDWLKRPGDLVKRGDPIAVVETQKGAIDVECYQEGKLLRYLVDTGSRVPVGTPLAELEETDDGATAPATSGASAAPSEAPEWQAGSGATPGEAASAALRPQPVASPAARRLAAEKGVDLSRLTGSGPAGAITSEDVVAAARTGTVHYERKGVDMAGMRKAVGAAMARSKREIPHYYLAHDIDLTTARRWLAESNSDRDPERRLLMAALLLKASALALAKYPALNGFWIDDAFRPGEAVHVGMAVSIRGGGLVAPAIRHTDTLRLDELMQRLQDNVMRARAGRLRSSELAAATATVSSLGERGVDSLYGVISPPQVALIGFGRPRMRAWVSGDTIEPREVVTLTLAADHRASDGQRGALLLAEIDRLLQRPEVL